MPNQSLKKILIQGYSNPKCKGKANKSIRAVINPDTYTRNFGVRYNPSGEVGSNGETQRFGAMDSSNFKMDLLVDGTGVIPMKGMTVDDYIEDFKKVVYNYVGNAHEPNYLKIVWGKNIFIGVCESLEIHYTLFNPDGTALRATIKLTLLKTVGFRTKAKEAQKSSPDLTHIITVNAGDNLPLMTYRIYADSSYYLEVAKANGLNSFLSIKPGDQLYFPPIKK